MNNAIIPQCELSDADYRILKYVGKFDHVTKKSIVTALRHKIDAVEYRIDKLSYIDFQVEENPNTNYIIQECKITGEIYGGPQLKPIDRYHLSELGKKVLQDYKLNKKQTMKALRLQGIWLPIIMSILTTIILHLLQWLLPKILK